MSPFDKTRYNELLKGLEISEIRKKALNSECRLDAEYFSKAFLEANKTLDLFGTSTIGDCVIDGIHTSIDYDDSSNINLISAMSPQDNYFDLSRGAHISESMHKENLRTSLQEGDVIISTVGTIGNAAVVDKTLLPANCDRHVGIIRRKGYSSYVLSTFLLSKYGLAQTMRESTGNVQLSLFIYKIREIKIPDFSTNFQSYIENIVKNALHNIYKANKIYYKVELEALTELGFANWSPTNKSVSVKNFTSFSSSERLDAEFFQPKYDELFALLDKCTTRPLGGKDGLVDIQKSIEPGSDVYSNKGLPFVRIADLSQMGISQPKIYIPQDICKNIPRPKINTILLSKDGSIGIAYKVDNDLNVITSSGILHLTIKDANILPDYLTLIINSKIVRMQAERDSGGSIIQHWKQKEIERVKIPLLPLPHQQKIASEIQTSFALRNGAKQRLYNAKSAIEVAIEQGENKALDLLKTETIENYE